MPMEASVISVILDVVSVRILRRIVCLARRGMPCMTMYALRIVPKVIFLMKKISVPDVQKTVWFVRTEHNVWCVLITMFCSTTFAKKIAHLCIIMIPTWMNACSVSKTVFIVMIMIFALSVPPLPTCTIILASQTVLLELTWMKLITVLTVSILVLIVWMLKHAWAAKLAIIWTIPIVWWVVDNRCSHTILIRTHNQPVKVVLPNA